MVHSSKQHISRKSHLLYVKQAKQCPCRGGCVWYKGLYRYPIMLAQVCDPVPSWWSYMDPDLVTNTLRLTVIYSPLPYWQSKPGNGCKWVHMNSVQVLFLQSSQMESLLSTTNIKPHPFQFESPYVFGLLINSMISHHPTTWATPNRSVSAWCCPPNTGRKVCAAKKGRVPAFRLLTGEVR